MYLIWYIHQVGSKPALPEGKRVPAFVYRTEAGHEPVRDWLRSLPYDDDKKRIGTDMKTVEFGWPLGMPVCRSLGDGLCEVRTALSHNRIARVLFYMIGDRGWCYSTGLSRRPAKLQPRT